MTIQFSVPGRTRIKFNRNQTSGVHKLDAIHRVGARAEKI